VEGHAQDPLAQNWRAPHAWPQVPQFAAVVRVSTSQPFAMLPSQSAKPGRHWMPQVPPAQRGAVEPIGDGAGTVHTVPQVPQLFTSVVVSTQDEPQRVSLARHPVEQPAVPHTGVATPQVVAHAPQFAGSVAAVVHAKVAPHERNPVLHWHVPSLQVALAPHTVPHVPQFAPSVRVFTSQPFAAAWSQSANPVAQPQCPPVHAWPAAQRMPQPPQFWASLARLASQPFATIPSQSPMPVMQTHAPSVHI